MPAQIEAAFTRSNDFLRTVIFLKEGKKHIDLPVSVVFSSVEKEGIFIPEPKEDKTDPVYPEEGAGQFVRRIEKGIYHATLFGTKKELDGVKKVNVFACGKESSFDF